MFGFKLWGRFGSFRDPITITQNMTFSIPPKTTVGGVLASILGIDYNDYFNDNEYFDFGYSLILKNPVRKKSFAQNYLMDYTEKSLSRLNLMLDIRDNNQKLLLHEKQKKELESKELPTKAEEKKIKSLGKRIATTKEKLNKSIDVWKEKSAERFTKAKPIYRELLINPSFYIFINKFKHEDKIIELMKEHLSEFPLYMGNSEFAANYQFIDCHKYEKKKIMKLDSFTGNPEKIKFETGKKYTNVYAATRTTGSREYRDYKSMVVCDKKIILSSAIDGYSLNTDTGDFNCEFI
ncbi:MAG: CRISPR-associated protein Cas5 [Bacteroidetes bacterium]|nr:CRISPR-associated protein Cas5 [Bacteroidota bacterium]